MTRISSQPRAWAIRTMESATAALFVAPVAERDCFRIALEMVLVPYLEVFRSHLLRNYRLTVIFRWAENFIRLDFVVPAVPALPRALLHLAYVLRNRIQSLLAVHCQFLRCSVRVGLAPGRNRA